MNNNQNRKCQYSRMREYEKTKDFPRTLQPLAGRLLRKGRAFVKGEYEKGYRPAWPEKLAEIVITWRGNKYRIPYKAFKIDIEDQAMIYSLERYLINEFSDEIANCTIGIYADGFMD